MSDLIDDVPQLRRDYLRRDLDGGCVVWSPASTAPTVLDPVAAVMLDVIDGEASVGQLATDVHEEVGVPLDVARRQVERTMQLFGQAGLLSAPGGDAAMDAVVARRELFADPPTSCAEQASRLGGVTSLNLRFGDDRLRVACDSRRAVRRLRAALADHVADGGDDAPLGFVLTAPAGFQRHHLLVDRYGFALSRARGLDAGLHALGSHLTTLLPSSAGTVRVRTHALTTADGMVLCLFPPEALAKLDERELVRSGCRLVDRLAVDVEVATGVIVNGDVPWPEIQRLSPGAGHAGPGGRRTATAVVDLVPPGSPPLTPAGFVARLAAGALHGDPENVLDATSRLVAGATLLSVPPEPAALAELLREFSAR